MARISNLVIKESIEELENLFKSQSKSKNIDRIQVLISIKEDQFTTRQELSDFTKISRRSLERWLFDYRTGGLDKMLLPKKRKRKSNLISTEVHDALKKRVYDSEDGFLSYVEAQQWVESEFALNLKYNTIREYLMRHFKTKIKTPRKSHIKKDKNAVNGFLKTA